MLARRVGLTDRLKPGNVTSRFFVNAVHHVRLTFWFAREAVWRRKADAKWAG